MNPAAESHGRGFDPITLRPIGHVAGGRSEPIDDDWGDIVAAIHLDRARFETDCTAGLETFSHIEVIFHFDQVDESRIHTGARHPRGREDWPAVGIFAQRAKARPNRLGLTICELVGVDGLTLTVRGLDAIDGSPVLDIKPAMVEFGVRGHLRQPEWSHELMAGYW